MQRTLVMPVTRFTVSVEYIGIYVPRLCSFAKRRLRPRFWAAQKSARNLVKKIRRQMWSHSKYVKNTSTMLA